MVFIEPSMIIKTTDIHTDPEFSRTMKADMVPGHSLDLDNITMAPGSSECHPNLYDLKKERPSDIIITLMSAQAADMTRKFFLKAQTKQY